MKSYNVFITSLFFWLAFALTGCGVYSFTGTNIDPAVKTMSVLNFENNSGQGPSNLTQLVSEEFRDFFQRNTNLKLVPQNGDLQFEGQILSFNFSPAALQKQGETDVASVNRLTISLQVRYRNSKDPKQDFEQSFSAFRDFQQNQNISSIDNAALRPIIEQLVFDVFNKSLANW
ncbi:MAG: LPS assembly lipoprotein LptE [Bacteroidota bacterium]|nr:LPS assembly lipoprotein LptE [Bacteroidota bacterium]